MKFEDLNLTPSLHQSVQKLNYNECTPIQEKAIPPILAGRDVAGLAQTGTGKTAAFLLPLMERILRSKPFNETVLESDSSDSKDGSGSESEKKKEGTSGTTSEANVSTQSEVTPIIEKSEMSSGPAGAEVIPINEAGARGFNNWKKSNFILVLVPTRELAEQVQENVQKLGSESGLAGFAIYGGTSYDRQKEALAKGLNFIVATPGRLIDLYKEHLIDLKQVRGVVFDEADRMFDMGFKDDMKYILQRIPRDRQFLVFSATLNFDVLNTAYQFGADPYEINISRDQAKAENVKDEIFHVGQDEKPQHLLSVLKAHNPKQAIIFTNFKHNVDRVTKFLVDNGVPAIAISSLLSQAQRNKVIEQFKAVNEHNILVATDVAARGLDIQGVDMVINYEMPSDCESYVHRIGRTGRAGATGLAFSLVSDKDIEALERIENYLKNKISIAYFESEKLIKDFKPFQYTESRDSFNRGDRGSSERSGGGGRGGSGHRPEGGRSFDRRPRGGGDRFRPSDRDRDRDRGNSSDRPVHAGTGEGRDQNRDQNRSGAGRGPRDQQTRDQQSGNSSSFSRRPQSGRHNSQQSSGGSGGGGRGRFNESSSDEQRPQRSAGTGGSGTGGGHHSSRHPSSRHHSSSHGGTAHSSSHGPRHQGRNAHGTGGNAGARGAKGAAATSKSTAGKSIGQKITGFFKKLFKS